MERELDVMLNYSKILLPAFVALLDRAICLLFVAIDREIERLCRGPKLNIQEAKSGRVSARL
jgi:hypothetical protein